VSAARGRFVLAVDGPSGTGKSSVSRQVAHRIGAGYLDTGAMYRVATLHALRLGVDPSDTDAVVSAVRGLPLRIGADPLSEQVLLGDEDVAGRIRDAAVDAAVSAVSAIPEVRRALTDLQRELSGACERMVVEGRDIGTVVLPDADLKIFLTASAEARAQRRNDQNIGQGGTDDYASVLESVRRRDRTDAARAASPLRAADDARVVETDEMEFDAVVGLISELAERSMGAMR